MPNIQQQFFQIRGTIGVSKPFSNSLRSSAARSGMGLMRFMSFSFTWGGHAMLSFIVPCSMSSQSISQLSSR